jgi:hypothetical protein
MVKRRAPPSQGWRTFLRNHAPDIPAMDLFVVPTIGFGLLYAFVIVRFDRRDLVWINFTANPTAEWLHVRYAGIPPGGDSALPHPRSRPYLWQRRHAPIARHGHPGQACRTGLALAEWLCRTTDRMDPVHAPSSADSITATPAFKLSVHTISSPAILGGLHHHYVRV